MKKLLSVLLAVAMILCVAPMAFAADESSVHMHSVSTDCSASEGSQKLFLPLTQELAEYGRFIGGNYYLTEDISIEKELIVVSGVVNICLNGYKITRTQIRSGVSSPVIDVWENGELNICDCKGSGSLYSPNCGLLLRGTANLYGGQIYAEERGVNLSGGREFNMYGGKIYGYGIGVYVSGGIANLYGGIVSSDMDATLVDSMNGGEINVDGTEICDDMCHSQGFRGLIWKIVVIFYKLFNLNPVCACGKVHY